MIVNDSKCMNIPALKGGLQPGTSFFWGNRQGLESIGSLGFLKQIRHKRLQTDVEKPWRKPFER